MGSAAYAYAVIGLGRVLHCRVSNRQRRVAVTLVCSRHIFMVWLTKIAPATRQRGKAKTEIVLHEAIKNAVVQCLIAHRYLFIGK